MIEEPNTGTHEDEKIDSGLYRALLSHYLHQDRLLWSRVQLLVAVQGAVLAGSYALRDNWLAIAIVAAGAVLTILLIALVEKDSRDRDVNRPIMDHLGKRLLPAELRGQSIRMTSKERISGRLILRLVLWAFVAVDVILGMLYLCHLGLFASRRQPNRVRPIIADWPSRTT